MGIAGSHHRAAIFKYLRIIDEGTFAQFLPLLRPGIDKRRRSGTSTPEMLGS
jgi:hypothetical protein